MSATSTPTWSPEHGYHYPATYANYPVKPPRRRFSRRKIIIIAGITAAVILAVVLIVYFVAVRPKQHNDSHNGSSSSGSRAQLTTGGDGSTVTTEDGSKFIYNNSFGGFWITDPGNPFNNNAQPNSWTPPLNTSWRWGVDRIHGVNLGGLFVLEPFITPSLFQKYPDTIDEWTLSVAMANDAASGGLGQLETHYDTFITEQDIAEIAGAGLNWIRVPIPFWAIETWQGEPFLAKTSWKYFLRVVGWARKYGLRINLDLHTVPGSQNGYGHSGRLGSVNFMAGNMGLANAGRTLYYIRVLTEFISQPAYRDVIPVFGIVNEAFVADIGLGPITSFYLQAHDMIRSITGRGQGNGPYISIHDGFQPTNVWANFLQGSDRIILDGHPYFSFGGVDTSPMAVLDDKGNPGGKWPTQACNAWGPAINKSQTAFGVTISGEFAASPNDCGLFLLGVGQVSTNPFCPEYDDYLNYNETMRAGLLNYVLGSMDAMGDWFFWTWKIGPDQSGKIGAPSWSYQLGLQKGWIPRDPRVATGKCQALGLIPIPFDGNYAPWATGGVTSSIPASSSASFPWPPNTMSRTDVPISLLPTYTSTGPVITMPAATFTAAPSSITAPVNGWFNPQDTTGGIVPVAGCTYPDEYNGIFKATPVAPCTGPTNTP